MMMGLMMIEKPYTRIQRRRSRRIWMICLFFLALLLSASAAKVKKARRGLKALDELEDDLEKAGALIQQYGTSQEITEWEMFEEKVAIVPPDANGLVHFGNMVLRAMQRYMHHTSAYLATTASTSRSWNDDVSVRLSLNLALTLYDHAIQLNQHSGALYSKGVLWKLYPALLASIGHSSSSSLEKAKAGGWEGVSSPAYNYLCQAQEAFLVHLGERHRRQCSSIRLIKPPFSATSLASNSSPTSTPTFSPYSTSSKGGEEGFEGHAIVWAKADDPMPPSSSIAAASSSSVIATSIISINSDRTYLLPHHSHLYDYDRSKADDPMPSPPPSIAASSSSSKSYSYQHHLHHFSTSTGGGGVYLQGPDGVIHDVYRSSPQDPRRECNILKASAGCYLALESQLTFPGHSILIPSATSLLTAFSGGGFFYHWLLDALPRLLLLRQTLLELKGQQEEEEGHDVPDHLMTSCMNNITVIIPSPTPSTSHILEGLKLLAIATGDKGRDLPRPFAPHPFSYNGSGVLAIQELWHYDWTPYSATTSPSSSSSRINSSSREKDADATDRIDGGASLSPHTKLCAPPSGLRLLRSTLIKTPPPPIERRALVWLTREEGSPRSVANEKEVMTALRKVAEEVGAEFKAFDGTKEGIKGAMQLMPYAHVAIGVHGANLANTAFMQEGSHVLEITLEEREFREYEHVAWSLGLVYQPLRHLIPPSSFENILYLPPEVLAAAVRQAWDKEEDEGGRGVAIEEEREGRRGEGRERSGSGYMEEKGRTNRTTGSTAADAAVTEASSSSTIDKTTVPSGKSERGIEGSASSSFSSHDEL